MSKTVEIPRDLAERLAKNLAYGSEAWKAHEELCKILEAPVVEYRLLMEYILSAEECEPIAKHLCRSDVRCNPAMRYRISISNFGIAAKGPKP